MTKRRAFLIATAIAVAFLYLTSNYANGKPRQRHPSKPDLRLVTLTPGFTVILPVRTTK